jgi:hypothetical protein
LEKEDLASVDVKKPGHVKRFLLAAKELKETLQTKNTPSQRVVNRQTKSKKITVAAPPPKPAKEISDDEFIQTPKKKKVKVYQEPQIEEGKEIKFFYHFLKIHCW